MDWLSGLVSRLGSARQGKESDAFVFGDDPGPGVEALEGEEIIKEAPMVIDGRVMQPAEFRAANLSEAL